MEGLTDNELKAYLKGLVLFIESSANAYDAGYEGEAQRMAVAIRAIIEGTEESGPLLERLGLDFYYYDNSPDYHPELELPFVGLALSVRKGAWEGFIPRLGQNPGVKTKKVSFEEWWGKTVFADAFRGIKLTRKDIIHSVSNTDTDLPVYKELNHAFNELILAHPIGWVDERKAVERGLAGVEFASVRQIAYELLMALKEEAPDYT